MLLVYSCLAQWPNSTFPVSIPDLLCGRCWGCVLKFCNFCQILANSRGFSSARWWFAGITRDVYVYARPKQHIRDLAVRAGSDGKLEVEVVPWRLL